MPNLDPNHLTYWQNFVGFILTRAKIGKNPLKFDLQVIRNSRKGRVSRYIESWLTKRLSGGPYKNSSFLWYPPLSVYPYL